MIVALPGRANQTLAAQTTSIDQSDTGNRSQASSSVRATTTPLANQGQEGS